MSDRGCLEPGYVPPRVEQSNPHPQRVPLWLQATGAPAIDAADRVDYRHFRFWRMSGSRYGERVKREMLARGGVTLAAVPAMREGPDGQLYHCALVGVAVCAASDPYNRARGRELAEYRARNAFAANRAARDPGDPIRNPAAWTIAELRLLLRYSDVVACSSLEARRATCYNSDVVAWVRELAAVTGERLEEAFGRRPWNRPDWAAIG